MTSFTASSLPPNPLTGGYLHENVNTIAGWLLVPLASIAVGLVLGAVAQYALQYVGVAQVAVFRWHFDQNKPLFWVLCLLMIWGYPVLLAAPGFLFGSVLGLSVSEAARRTKCRHRPWAGWWAAGAALFGVGAHVLAGQYYRGSFDNLGGTAVASGFDSQILTTLLIVVDAIAAMISVFTVVYFRMFRFPFCESCQAWYVSRNGLFSVELVSALAEVLRTGDTDQLPPVAKQATLFDRPRLEIEFLYCPHCDESECCLSASLQYTARKEKPQKGWYSGTCMGCGGSVSPTASSCHHCGARFTSTQFPPSEHEEVGRSAVWIDNVVSGDFGKRLAASLGLADQPVGKAT